MKAEIGTDREGCVSGMDVNLGKVIEIYGHMLVSKEFQILES